MRGVLITGGEFPSLDIVREELDRASFICAADSGLDTAHIYGCKPDLILGDMDSLEQPDLLAKYSRDSISTFPRDKDYSDTELGINALFDRGFKDVVLIGGGGGRADHFLALWELYQTERFPVRWYSRYNCCYYADKEMELDLPVGSLVSFFTPSGSTARYRSEGLKWPLDDFVIGQGSVSLSNRVVKSPIKVQKVFGTIIIVSNY